CAAFAQLAVSEICEEPVDPDRHEPGRRERDAEHAERPAEPSRAAASRAPEPSVVVAERLPGEPDREDPESDPDRDREPGVQQLVRPRVPGREDRDRHRRRREEPGRDRADRPAVPGGARRLGRLHYCFWYGRPSAAGGTERPITPATAISVSTYGSAWKRTAAESEYS